ncbi:MAG TPA: hypothetical protein VGI06_00815 [Acidimicrobiales bacterium]
MQGTRMVPLVQVPSEFAGRVLVAKLGSAGIIAELRGVSRVYPTMFGTPVVWVEEGAAGEARELVTADTDDVLSADPDDSPRPSVAGPVTAFHHPLRPVIVAIALVLLASFAVGTRSCSASAVTTTAPVR